MNNTACCFTGHRYLPANRIEQIMINLDREIENLITQGVTEFYSGGALGFDQMAACLIIAKKEMGKRIRLIFALPCKNQDARWSNEQKALYRKLLNEADEIIYVSEAYDALCMRRRNEYMVDHAAYCICALTNERSGTGQTVRFAHKIGLQIINVAQ